MVYAEQNVLDAELEIEGGNRPAALALGDGRRRLLRGQPAHPSGAVQEGDAHQDIGHGILEAVDANGLAAQRIERAEAPGLHRCILGGSGGHRRNGRGATGECCRQRKAQFAAHRRLEQHVEFAGALFAQFEIRRTHLVGGASRHLQQQTANPKKSRRRQDGGAPRPGMVVGRAGGPHGCTPVAAARAAMSGFTASSMTKSYFLRSSARYRSFADFSSSRIHSSTTRSRSSENGRNWTSCRVETRTRCRPYPDSIGPLHAPDLSENTARAKPGPKAPDIDCSVSSRNSGSSNKRSPSSALESVPPSSSSSRKAAAASDRAWARRCGLK